MFFCKTCLKKIIWAKSDNTCIKCGRILTKKYDDLRPWDHYICSDCIEKEYHFDKVISVLLYGNLTKTIPITLKIGEEYYLLELMAKLMINRIREEKFLENIDYISYVPMATSKLKKRGFNHSFLLAKIISEEMNKKLILNSIIKSNTIVDTKFLTETDRYKFLKDSFGVNNHFNFNVIKNKNILIIDDVFTTGYTLSVLSKIYKNKGALKVYGITFTTRQIKIPL